MGATRAGRAVIRIAAAVYAGLLIVSFAVRHTRAPGADPDPADRRLTVPVVTGVRPIAAAARAPVSIVYREYLPTDGRSPAATIVMLHGSPGSKSDFRRVGPLVADRFGDRVIAPDLPGFGWSTMDLPDYSFLAGAVYVRELMDRLGIARAHVVAYSMAGGDALHLADLAPDRISSITLLSSIGVQEMELLGEYHVNHSVHAFQLGALWMLRELTPHFGLLDRGVVEYARNFYDSDQRPLRGILQHLAMPVLIVHATDDVLVPYEAAIEHHRIVPQSELLTRADGNHFMPFTRAPFLAEAIGSFVARVEHGEAATRATADPERIREAALPFDPAHLPKARGIAALVWTGLLAAATFVSEDLTGIAAGVLAAQGRLSFTLAVAGCFVGIVAGDLLLFLAGRYIGRPIVDLPPFNWVITPAAIERSSAWLERRGAAVVMFSRFTPGMRLPTYVAAGVLRTSVWRFLGWFLVAAAIWTPLLVGASALGGDALLHVTGVGVPRAAAVLLAIAVLAIAIRLAVSAATWRGRRRLLSRWRRLTRWEFWPPWIFYPPVVAYIVALMIRHRSATVFTAANPAILGGGFVGESKHEILRGLTASAAWIARSTLMPGEMPADEKLARARAFLQQHALGFPVVLKPDQGQRGSGVVIVRDEQELARRLQASTAETILQEHVRGAEFGLFYCRRPSEPAGRIFSITEKRFPAVVGDGRRTLEDLILQDDRAVCMARFYCDRHRDRLAWIPAAGEHVQLVELGTHCRGAMFLDGWWAWSDALERRFDEIARRFDGFYFGRFDVRTWDVDAFREGGAFRIIELNGVTSEATHIYDPDTRLAAAYRVLMNQWRLAFEIGSENRARGVRPTSLRTLVRLMVEYRRTAKRHLVEAGPPGSAVQQVAP